MVVRPHPYQPYACRRAGLYGNVLKARALWLIGVCGGELQPGPWAESFQLAVRHTQDPDLVVSVAAWIRLEVCLGHAYPVVMPRQGHHRGLCNKTRHSLPLVRLAVRWVYSLCNVIRAGRAATMGFARSACSSLTYFVSPLSGRWHCWQSQRSQLGWGMSLRSSPLCGGRTTRSVWCWRDLWPTVCKGRMAVQASALTGLIGLLSN